VDALGTKQSPYGCLPVFSVEGGTRIGRRGELLSPSLSIQRPYKVQKPNCLWNSKPARF